MEHPPAGNFVERTRNADDSNALRADLEDGWTEEQAQGLLDSLELAGAVPNWKAEHLTRLYCWCSDHLVDHKTVEGQLEFIAYDLCRSYRGIGMALKQAQTVNEAKEAVKQYVQLLSAG